MNRRKKIPDSPGVRKRNAPQLKSERIKNPKKLEKEQKLERRNARGACDKKPEKKEYFGRRAFEIHAQNKLRHPTEKQKSELQRDEEFRRFLLAKKAEENKRLLEKEKIRREEENARKQEEERERLWAAQKKAEALKAERERMERAQKRKERAARFDAFEAELEEMVRRRKAKLGSRRVSVEQ